MQFFTPASIPLLLVPLSLISISPPPAGATPDDKCHPCLTTVTRDLRTVSKCDLLTPFIPALPSSENNAAIIQRYKDTYPDAVDCLCSADKWIEVEEGPQDWVSRRGSVCTVAVFKNQKRILEAFQKQLSCGGGDNDGEGKGKVGNVSSEGSASQNLPPAVSQTLATPPVRKPANEAAPLPSPPPPPPPSAAAAAPEARPAAGINAVAPSVAAPKPKEVAVTKPDPKLAAAASTSSTTPDMKDSNAGGDAKPVL